MAVILGLSAEQVEAMVQDVNLPNDLWLANVNCPGQVVISGTLKGIEAGSEAAKKVGAKRVLPIQVHGAFHSGLMREAEEALTDVIMEVPFGKSQAKLAMNVTGGFVSSSTSIRKNLIKQVTSPVRWQKCVESMHADGADLFVEIGCGKTLAGFNKRLEFQTPTISIEKVADLDLLETYI